MLSRGFGQAGLCGSRSCGYHTRMAPRGFGRRANPPPHGTTRYRRPDSALIPAHSPTPGLEPAASSVAPPPRDGTGGGGARWAGS